MQLEHVPYTQIDELTEAHREDNRHLFGELIHPSGAGHQLMAEHIMAALRAHGLLQKLADRDVVS
jgi:phospholipase/lecithinase/hemolysin